MVLKQSDLSSYFWPVKHKIPHDGKLFPVELMAKFNRITNSRIQEITDALTGKEEAKDVDGNVTQEAIEPVPVIDFIDELLCGWKDVKGLQADDGNQPSYDDLEQREWVLELAGMPNAIAQSWMNSVTKGRVKNS